jgi:hypothetical protein
MPEILKLNGSDHFDCGFSYQMSFVSLRDSGVLVFKIRWLYLNKRFDCTIAVQKYNQSAF